MVKSVKANYAFNLLNTISGLLFPLLTFPYASRIMMADGIGHVNFISLLFLIFHCYLALVSPMYAVREIAKVRNDKEVRGKEQRLKYYCFIPCLQSWDI